MAFIKIDGAFVGDSKLIIERLETQLAGEGTTPFDVGISSREHARERSGGGARVKPPGARSVGLLR